MGPHRAGFLLSGVTVNPKRRHLNRGDCLHKAQKPVDSHRRKYKTFSREHNAAWVFFTSAKQTKCSDSYPKHFDFQVVLYVQSQYFLFITV